MARAKIKGEYDTFDKLLSRFKKSVDRDNVIKIYSENEFYEKPSTVRKKAKAQAIKRHKKTLSDEQKKLNEMRLQSKR